MNLKLQFSGLKENLFGFHLLLGVWAETPVPLSGSCGVALMSSELAYGNLVWSAGWGNGNNLLYLKHGVISSFAIGIHDI